jgi:hypothetical protein
MGESFDSMSKEMAQGIPRRKALKLAAAALGGTTFALLTGGRAQAAPRTCVTCLYGTGNPCNVKQSSCTEVRSFPADQSCPSPPGNLRFCGTGQTFHCPHGCPA